VPNLVRLGAWATVALVAAGTAFGVTRPPCRGPATVASASPADGAALVRAPTEVELAFTAQVDLGRSHVSVRDRYGTTVALGQPRLDRPDRIEQRVEVTTKGPVTVAYHVTFVDGTELAGTLRFSVATGAAADTETAADTRTASGAAHEHGVDPVSAVLLALDALVVLVALVLAMRRRPVGTRPGG
jgi:methionine-rich copper-binding protein CopC